MGRGNCRCLWTGRNKDDFGVLTVGECPIGEYTRCLDGRQPKLVERTAMYSPKITYFWAIILALMLKISAFQSSGPFINNATQILTFSDSTPNSVMFHHKNVNPPQKKMSQINIPLACLINAILTKRVKLHWLQPQENMKHDALNCFVKCIQSYCYMFYNSFYQTFAFIKVLAMIEGIAYIHHVGV